jgi:cardiolipin synthase (CMP-forming)
LRHLPNLLTILRIVMTPFVVVAITQSHYRTAFLLGAIAGATDGLDGWLARRFDWRSRLGAFLDPLADKPLVVLGYVALGWQGVVPWWLVSLVVARDAIILLVAAFALAFKKIQDFPPSRWGTLSTIVQIAAAGEILAANGWPESPLHWLVVPAIWLVGAATVWSGVHYAWTTSRRLSSNSAPADFPRT